MSSTRARHTTRPAPAPRKSRSGTSRRRPTRTQPRRHRLLWAVGGTVGALALLFAIFLAGHAGAGSGGSAAYQVARPATGEKAPEFTLPSAQGGNVDLSALRGQTVLLFFQEGIGCEPCWQQAKDLEGAPSQLRTAGIDRVLTITTNTLDQLRQKAADEGLSTPVLADTDFAVSRAYNANAYGMMGNAADGHTFVLVGPDGTIRWRADYGGPPDYTMYVPVSQLLDDIAKHGGGA